MQWVPQNLQTLKQLPAQGERCLSLLDMKRSEAGMISLWAIAVALFTLAISSALFAYMANERKMSEEYLVETRLRLAAESAVEHTAHRFEEHPELVKKDSAAQKNSEYSVFYHDHYDVFYKDDSFTADIEAKRENKDRREKAAKENREERIIITAIARRNVSVKKDWERHKVVHGIVTGKDKSYRFAGWAE